MRQRATKLFYCNPDTQAVARGEAHVLGLVCRDGAGIQYLALFREAWPQLDAEVQLRYLQDAVPLTRLYEGKGIYCSICQRQRDWNIGQDQLASLVHRYRHDRR